MTISKTVLRAINDKIDLLNTASNATYSPLMRRLALLHVLQAIAETVYAHNKQKSPIVHFRQILSHLSMASITTLFNAPQPGAQTTSLWDSAWADINTLTDKMSQGDNESLPPSLNQLCQHLSQTTINTNNYLPSIELVEQTIQAMIGFTPSAKLTGYRQHRNSFYQDRNRKIKSHTMLIEHICQQMDIETKEALLLYAQDKHLPAIRALAKKCQEPSIMKSSTKKKLDDALKAYHNQVSALYPDQPHDQIKPDQLYQLHYSLHQNGYIKNTQNALLFMIDRIRKLFDITSTVESEIDDSAYTDQARIEKKSILHLASQDCQWLANTRTQTRKNIEHQLGQDTIKCFAARIAIALVWESMNNLVEYPNFNIKMRKVRNYLFHAGLHKKRDNALFMERTTTYCRDTPQLVAQQLYIVTINLYHVLNYKINNQSQEYSTTGAVLTI